MEGSLKPMGRPDGRRAAVGLGRICGAEGAVVMLEGSLWGWGGSYGAAVGLEGVLWGWGESMGLVGILQ